MPPVTSRGRSRPSRRRRRSDAAVEYRTSRLPAVLHPGLQQVRVVGGDGLGDREFDRRSPTDPRRCQGVHRRRGGLRQVAGGLGDLAGLPRRDRQRSTADKIRGVGVRGPGRRPPTETRSGGDPESGGERFGVNAATNGVPARPRAAYRQGTSRAGRCRTRHRPRLGAGRCSTHQRAATRSFARPPDVLDFASATRSSNELRGQGMPLSGLGVHVVRSIEWTRLERGVDFERVKLMRLAWGSSARRDLSGGDELFELRCPSSIAESDACADGCRVVGHNRA